MGDYYDFEIREIDGKEVAGFVYQNCSTGFKGVFVDLSFNQMELAVAWHNKERDLMQEKQRLIKGFLGI
tara:strand:+ start:493 stop:699 length:207 start_codon:yes stop_codon:yes gene_type:complete